jgi:predicted flavoprotein YhiN
MENFKEEFVTAGGINLKEINFKTMESKLHENPYFAGEIVSMRLPVDLTQNAWTRFILANSI